MTSAFSLFGLVVALFAVPAAWAAAPTVFVDQGPNWNATTRTDFYSRDQGSRIIPLAWLQALKQRNGQPFLADSLARYGYLPKPANNNGLPIGFTASGPTGNQIAGMTCSACHTRQITAEGNTYRIDGGPAIVDFQSLLADLDTAVGQVLANAPAFDAFAAQVLASATPDADDVATLRQQVDLWYLRFHTLMTRALPKSGWGAARLDAVGMIFDRLTGLDIGPPPSYLIADNIKTADAPVRYPFLWKAPEQDQTQWPGFADNGSDILGLARNLGEVFGVFAVVEPVNHGWYVDFLNNNSANFDGLSALEDLVKEIGPPKWPWLIDSTLAAQGKTIFDRPTDQGGCASCHGIKSGKVRLPLMQTWATPVQPVGTDTREYDTLAWTVNTGTLEGAFIPFVTNPLQPKDLAFNVLAVSVIGTIAQEAGLGSGAPKSPILVAVPHAQIENVPGLPLKFEHLPPALRDLQRAFHLPGTHPQNPLTLQGLPVPIPAFPAAPPPPKGSYEARVLQGIWAAAPYLHNGSVPTLSELLKPSSERVKEFKIGTAYDIVNVGLAAEQPQAMSIFVTTDCSNLNSGNSNCGHEYGTKLTDQEKKALLEYLKTL